MFNFKSACIYALLFAMGTAAAAQQMTAPDRSKKAPRALPAKQFEVFAPYWTLEPGWHSELMLRNNSSEKQISVTPILRLSSGNEVILEPVSLGPNETSTINIATSPALTAAGLAHRSGSYGSVLFRYSAQTAGNIYASVMIHMTERPIAFHYDAFAQAGDYPIDGYEGIWWLPEETTQCHLVISNLFDLPLKGVLDVLDSAGEVRSFPLALGPRQTNRFDVRSLVGAAKFAGSTGGIRIRFKAAAGATQVAMLNFDEDAKFSALMRVFPHESVSPATAPITLRAPTVALAVPDPALNLPEGTRLQSQIFLRNTTSVPLPIQTMIDWRSASSWGRKSIDVPPIPPNATTVLRISDLQDRKVIPPDANWATVTLDFVGHDGDLVPVTASYADHEQFLMQSPFSDWLSFMWKGGEWEVDANHNSLITTGNAGTKPTRAAVTIFYDQGKQKYDLAPRTLQPGEAMTINLAELIQKQTPDPSGKALPAALSTGSYEIRDLDSTDGQLYEGKIAIDRTNGHVTYGCALCCSFSDPYMTGFVGSPGDSGTVQVLAASSCTGSFVDETTTASGWSIGDPAVATVSSALVQAVAPGSTATFASARLRIPQSYKVCPLQTFPLAGPVTVAGFNLTGPQTIIDGEHGSFTITITGGTASAYQWTSSFPNGSGNSPNVNFSAPTSPETSTDGHWFASPNTACGASPNSTYAINATVTFQTVGQKSKATQLTVSLPTVGAQVIVSPTSATISGSPETSYNSNTQKQCVSGVGQLARVVPTTATYFIPSTSQFYGKTQAHEQVHINNWIQGAGHLFGDLFVVSDFYSQIQAMCDDSDLSLFDDIRQAKFEYITDQFTKFSQRQAQDESQAYSISDPITPQYLYQSACHTNGL